jgi:uncharacterized protein (DUF58 family)
MLLAVSLAVLFTVLFAMLFTVLFAVQVPERGPPGDEFDRRTVGVTLNGWDEPVPGACIRAGFSPDFPAAIVEQEVVVPAEEDSVSDICPAAVFGPEHDVVGFAPGRRPVAARGSASAPDDREGFPLFGGEKPMFAPVVKCSPVFVEYDPRDPRLAR